MKTIMSQKKNIYKSDNTILNDAYDRLVAQLYIKKQNSDLKAITVSGTEPGVGSTSITINLAISMANAGWKTLLIDADLRKEGRVKRLNEDSAGLAEYIDEDAKLEKVIIPTNHNDLFYMSSGTKEVNVVSALCSVRMKELMTKLRDEYDYIILDTPAMSSAPDAAVLSTVVDGVILVTSQQKGYTIKAVASAKKQLDEDGANILGIVVNRVEEAEYRRAMKNYDYFKKQKYKIKKSIEESEQKQKG